MKQISISKAVELLLSGKRIYTPTGALELLEPASWSKRKLRNKLFTSWQKGGWNEGGWFIYGM